MLELHNETNWSAGLYPGWNLKKKFQLITVFKAGYQFDIEGNVTPLDEPQPIIEADEHYGKPLETSLKAASEIAPFKDGGEVYLFGSAHPHNPDQTMMDVNLDIEFPDGRQFSKVLRIVGRRVWERVLLNYIMSKPATLESTPIKYEYAFGGSNPGDDGDNYFYNPVGMGFNSTGWQVANLELPRIEQAPQIVTSLSSKPLPAGFGPLAVFWQPRKSEIGEASEDPNENGGCPYISDSKVSLHNAAPHDQRFPKPFEGGEIVQLRGFFKAPDHEKTLRLTLPRLEPQLYTIIDKQIKIYEPVCDTLIIDTDKRTLNLIWRIGIPWRRLDRRQGWVILKNRAQDE